LLEVLTVVSIVAILAAIAFPAMAPAREKARQTRCASQLTQIHKAMMLYMGDHPGGEEVPGLSGVPLAPYVHGNKVLLPYLESEWIFWCPNTTPAEKRFHTGGSYVWSYLHPPLSSPSGGAPQRVLDKQSQEIQSRGSNYPLLVCFTHDQTFYQPRENWMDPMFNQPFVLELRASGSVFTGRGGYVRPPTPWQRPPKE
jgi:type II secretory pathway pseudopilin PulG